MLKYEYMVVSSHHGYINPKLEALFKEGWEIAGNSDVKYHGDPTNAAFIYIPPRREIK